METATTSLGHKPNTDDGRWKFDESVTVCFDDMLRRSIPMYDVMREACLAVGERYVRPGTDIVDLGASRGDGLEPFIRQFGSQVRYTAVEVSQPMLQVCRARYEDLIAEKVVRVVEHDLRDGCPLARASLTLCILTLQFVPMEYRQRVLRQAYQNTTPGGALILVEKVLGATADINAKQVEAYYDLKRRNGYSEEEINCKRLSLEGVLVPMTAKWNEDLLTAAGFDSVDCFWRWMNFAAWVAVKEPSGDDVDAMQFLRGERAA